MGTTIFFGRPPKKKMNLSVQRLSELATFPTQGSEEAAGWDLYSAQETCIPARSRRCVLTNVALAIPFGYYGRVAPRSGLALKNGIDIGAGVVDSDYRGDIGVVMFNHSDEDFLVRTKDRIAQIIFTPCPKMKLVHTESLPSTERQDAGFGSTGA